MRKNSVVFLSLLLLAACSLDFKREAGTAFLMTLPATELPPSRGIKGSLTLSLPEAAPELDTRRVALLHPDGHVDYYAETRWAEFLTPLIQEKLADAFARTGRFTAVMTDEKTSTPRFRLRLAVESFAAEYAAERQPPTIHLRLRGLLGDTNGKTIPPFFLETRQKAKADALPAIQEAYGLAFEEVTRQLDAEFNKTMRR